MRELTCECGKSIVQRMREGGGFVIKSRLIKSIDGQGMVGVCPACKKNVELPSAIFTKAIVLK